MMSRFMQGFFMAIIITSLLLGTQYGPNFNFLSEEGSTIIPTFGTALNWQTAIMFSTFFLILDRNQGSYLIPVFAWSLFDMLWIYKHSMMGSYLFGSKLLTYPTIRTQIIGYGRNILLLIASFSSTKQMKLSLIGKLFFTITGLYWLYLFFPLLGITLKLIPVRKLLFKPLLYYAINLAPFMICFKEWTGKTWKKFLFY